MKIARLKQAGSTLQIQGGATISSAETLSQEQYERLFSLRPELEPLFDIVEETPVVKAKKSEG